MARTKPGQIITFYSYKGGTGRSFLLANIAFLLACQGNKVCVVDFDLEAPGLHRYFGPFLEDGELEFTDGLLDWLWSTADSQMVSEKMSNEAGHLTEYAVSLARPGWTFPRNGQLDFIPAGRQDGEYSKRMTSFDWAAFYDRLGGGRHIERARGQLKADYDFIFIDSRTGVSDTAGVCTVTLPDRLVACYTLNRQSIIGVDQTLTRIRAQRPDRSLSILLVEARIETNEKAKLDAARAFARPRLGRHLTGETGRAYWDDMEVVYWPFYAFEECLAVFAEDAEVQTKLSMLDTVSRIAGRVSADPVGSRASIVVPTLSHAVRDPIMAEYTLGAAGPDSNRLALEGVFAEVSVRFHAYEADPSPRTLLRAATLHRLDESGPLPGQLASDENFLRFLINSRDYLERRGIRLRLALTLAVLAILLGATLPFILLTSPSAVVIAGIIGGDSAVLGGAARRIWADQLGRREPSSSSAP
jgi:cellulose biosynthesis protein BcsQ